MYILALFVRRTFITSPVKCFVYWMPVDSELRIEDDSMSVDTDSLVSTITSESSYRNAPSSTDIPQTKIKNKPDKKPASVLHNRCVLMIL